ncbi:MAG: tryptophan-rich sensory protein, partial [Alphaproteobacteria bacterium]|nr:tryptophan-rich sensory protein [Alphaproteobacteria bacterium]
LAQHDRWAAGLMLPYLAWVSLAVALNVGVVLLN